MRGSLYPNLTCRRRAGVFIAKTGSLRLSAPAATGWSQNQSAAAAMTNFAQDLRLQRISRTILILSICVLGASCSKYVYHHNEGKLARGTFTFLKHVYYANQFEDEETPQKRNQAILNDLADLDAMGSLASQKGLKQDMYYPEYMFRQEHARHGKAAIYYWQKKYKDKFNWQMLFKAEGLDYDEVKFLKEFKYYRATGAPMEHFQIANFESKPVTYGQMKRVMTFSDYEQFKNYTDSALTAGMRETLKSWLESIIHDRLIKEWFADEKELKRFDHDRVALLFLKVRYGKAGKGIYPGSMEKIPLRPTEIYDHFHKMQKALADVLWVKAAYTVVAEDSQGEELLAKLEKGGDFATLAPKYAAAPKYVKTAVPTVIKGYDRKNGLDEREQRDYYDRLILDMASRDVSKPDPYLGRDGIVIVRIYEVSRALEKVKLQDVAWKVENDLRIKMLNAVYEPDIREARAKLKFHYNDRLIKNLK
jgi:hypothetical protein